MEIMDFLASNGVGIVSTIFVLGAVILIFAVGLATVVKKVKSVSQFESRNYITKDEAVQLKEQNESIMTQLKKLSKA
jgi:hypothetical protein